MSRQSNILTIIKAEDFLSTEAKSGTVLEHTDTNKAKKASSKKTSAKSLVSTESIPELTNETPLGSGTDRTTQKKSKKYCSKEKAAVLQATVSAVKDNTLVAADPQIVKKILPPLPERTPADAYHIVTKYNYQRQSRKIFKLLPPATLDWIAEQMKTCTGRVADNLAVYKCRLFMPSKLIAIFCEDLIKVLFANPSIVIPTWNVLTDNTLTIRAKHQKLSEIGWTVEAIPECRKGTRPNFIKIYLLGQLLEHGIADN
ncbi:hypothetical protein [Chamaesiphon sp.]|uniref:hypothetical protein n=1 Tax=Chamaesiphon sp. TaxID=2814140 RepID=UPI00359447CF